MLGVIIKVSSLNFLRLWNANIDQKKGQMSEYVHLRSDGNILRMKSIHKKISFFIHKNVCIEFAFPNGKFPSFKNRNLSML